MSLKALIFISFLLCGPALADRSLIVIDPGHGGSQRGALGVGGYWEKQLALDVSLKVKRALEKRVDAEVVLTRASDRHVSLAQRVAMAQKCEPTLFLSIHGNSIPGKSKVRAQGIETYFLSATASGASAKTTAARENAEVSDEGPSSNDTLDFILRDLKRSEAHVDSSRLAYAVHEQLIQSTQAVDRGVQQAPFYVLTGVEAPAILIEVGFLTHPQEGKRLRTSDYQQRLSNGIVEGVVAFLEARKPSPQAQSPR